MPQKKKPTFFLAGGSSGDGEESSLESRYTRSSLTNGLQKPSKSTSFKPDVVTKTIIDKPYESEEAIDDSDDFSESAIEDDDEDWEDDIDAGQPANEEELFQRVDSSSQLTSRRSLIATMLSEKDRAEALQNAASRSSPALRRSRTSSHNGPLGSSPHDQVQLSRARPVVKTANPNESPIVSPRTNRRNMLSTELTGSLRQHLLWERQHKTPGAKALKNRRYKSEIRLSEAGKAPYMGTEADEVLQRNESFNYFDTGLQEYHEKGW
jgi:predicted transcriptional regulator